MSRLALGCALLVCAAGASADTITDISFTPGPLTSHTALTAVVTGTAGSSCIPAPGKASISGTTITLTIVPPPPLPCAAVITQWSVPLFIGTLAPAKYELVTTMGGAVLDRRSIVIADADPPLRILENVGPISGSGGVAIELVDPLPDTLDATVTFDDVPATVVSTVGTRLQVAPPPHAAGPVTVKVTIPGAATLTAFGGFRYVDLNGPVDRAAYEAILIPLIFAGEGAFGSQWTTDLWVYNGNAFDVTQLDGPFVTRVCIVAPCLQPIEALTTLKYNDALSAPFPHGRIMYLPRDGGAGLQFSLRVRDLTRQADALGTEVPVVRERDLRAGAFSLSDIPTDARYRVKLRIYSLETARAPVEVRFHRMTAPFTKAGETVVKLSAATRDTPAYAEADLEQIFPKLAGQGPFRVEVRPHASSAKPSYWAFISITNNQTQHVTVVTPQ
ncbi:MAG: IPT/TIG domain-containing protein [Acidobacteriota bacterium]